ncbi:MAG: heavy metal-binding domain-containing protein [Elusimicrobia bacterium]|nr:heavy metal-binding domain-containing protein [Elusimicrobiota bacterium]
MAIITGLSGNEMHCLSLKGMTPGELVVGNSVFSVGFIGGIASSLKTLIGGEVTQITSVIHEGRLNAIERLHHEARHRGADGVTGMSSEIIQHAGSVEFLSVGSCVHAAGGGGEHPFSTSADGQELYCQLDAGFHPVKFVFGNVAYSIGLGGGVLGALRSLKRGEVPEFSQVFYRTRHLALERIAEEARAAQANAVVGIRTSIVPFQGMQEMVMIGTASRHGALPAPVSGVDVVTSDLTNEEMWNLIRIGYMPVQLVLGVSVYSLGVVGGVSAFFRSLARGEIPELTTLIYEARANALLQVKRQAEACGADDVVGVKTYVYQLGGGMIEFLVIGTAVRRMAGLGTATEQLPPQAIIKDKDTFVNAANRALGRELGEPRFA